MKCVLIRDCSKDDRQTAAETATDEIVIGTVQALCEVTILVSQQNHSDLSLKALDDAVNRFYQKKGTVQE